jgi:HTH-type transcriptional regulator/antitoxin HigA
MVTKNRYRFRPDYAVPPGETLLETLDHIGMTQAELAERMGRPKKTINEIIKGKTAITPETSIQLERVLGIPTNFWNNLEINYRQTLAGIAERERLEREIEWLNKFPIKLLIELKYLRKTRYVVEQLDDLYKFFGVSNSLSWERIWLNPDATFRKSRAFSTSPEFVSTWLRIGELKGQQIECEPYSERAFKESLKKIRSLTQLSFTAAAKELIPLSASAGVAVVFVPSLPKTRVYGASKWLNKKKALIQLSDLYKTDDMIWFSFFHEAGHILLHKKSEVWIDDEKDETERNKEADQFATDFLIPQSKLRAYFSGRRISESVVRGFAQELNIAPSIVVGRLQHEKLLPPTHLNGLKEHLRIETILQ